MKGLKYLLVAIFIAILSLYIKNIFMYFYNPMQRLIANGLKLEVNPDFSGGKEIVRFMDNMGDDYGEGTLNYPRHPAFKGKGYLDVVRYIVYEPLTNFSWSEDRDFWQLGLTFVNVSNAFDTIYDFSHPVIHIYIDIDGEEGGSTETFYPRSELVKFDKEHPWDFMVEIDGHHEFGKVFSWDRKIEDKVRIYSVPEKKTVYARILLNNDRIKKVLDGRPTYHYVLVGAYDEYASGYFMTVKERSGSRYGGGAKSRLSPRVYDYVEPLGMNQKKVLASYNEEQYQYAVVYPLKAEKGKRDEQKKEEREKIIAKYHQLAEAEVKSQAKSVAELKAEGASRIEIAIAYLNEGNHQESEKILDSLLAEESDNAVANAYKGAIIAGKGGNVASPAKALQYVNEAYVYLDKAVKLAQNDEIVQTRMTRGSVSMYVPETIFGKSEQGAEDFIRAADYLDENNGDRRSIADCYFKAAVCYENASMLDEAEIYFLKAKSYDELPASAKYELAKRGYLH
jgi:tetratricopeptide (TPR) repeat protein